MNIIKRIIFALLVLFVVACSSNSTKSQDLHKPQEVKFTIDLTRGGISGEVYTWESTEEPVRYGYSDIVTFTNVQNGKKVSISGTIIITDSTERDVSKQQAKFAIKLIRGGKSSKVYTWQSAKRPIPFGYSNFIEFVDIETGYKKSVSGTFIVEEL